MGGERTVRGGVTENNNPRVKSDGLRIKNAVIEKDWYSKKYWTEQ